MGLGEMIQSNPGIKVYGGEFEDVLMILPL